MQEQLNGLLGKLPVAICPIKSFFGRFEGHAPNTSRDCRLKKYRLFIILCLF
jgi:hypothetical protein